MYFAGRFRYRKAGVLFGALAAWIVGVLPVVLVAPVWKNATWSSFLFFGAFFVCLICALLLYAGFRLLRRWFVGATLLLEITAEGVSYGGRLHAWEDIKWIGGAREQDRVQLSLRRKESTSELPLPLDDPLTVDRYDALMQELSAALREKHPQVAVG